MCGGSGVMAFLGSAASKLESARYVLQPQVYLSIFRQKILKGIKENIFLPKQNQEFLDTLPSLSLEFRATSC